MIVRRAWYRLREWASSVVMTNQLSLAALDLNGYYTASLARGVLKASMAKRPSVKRLAATVVLGEVPVGAWSALLAVEQRAGLLLNAAMLDASFALGLTYREKLAWGLVEESESSLESNLVSMEEEDRGVRSWSEICEDAWPHPSFEAGKSRRVEVDEKAIQLEMMERESKE